VDYTSAPEEASRELDRLRESGTLAGAAALERAGGPLSPLLVRPLVGDAADDWMPAVDRTIGVVSGVVAFSGPDMSETAEVAAQAAAWLGDRGRTIVLVDASVERPLLGKPLPEDGDEGLVDAVLFGVSPPAVVRRTLSPGVSVVITGSYPLSVDAVFDGGKLPTVLGRLAEDALVFLLVPPGNLSSVSGALDAAVCIAEGAVDIESVAVSVSGVRVVGILVLDEGEAKAGTRRDLAPTETRRPCPLRRGRPGSPPTSRASAPPISRRTREDSRSSWGRPRRPERARTTCLPCWPSQ